MKVTVKLKKKFEKAGFTQYDSPLLEKIYTEAKAHGWSGICGIMAYCETTYRAKLRIGKNLNWTSITFTDEDQFHKFMGNSK